MILSLVGFTATAFTIVSFLPQVLRAWRSRHTKDLSLATLGLLSCGALLWTAYGFLLEDLPIIVTNVSVLCSLILLVVAKLRFG